MIAQLLTAIRYMVAEKHGDSMITDWPLANMNQDAFNDFVAAVQALERTNQLCIGNGDDGWKPSDISFTDTSGKVVQIEAAHLPRTPDIAKPILSASKVSDTILQSNEFAATSRCIE